MMNSSLSKNNLCRICVQTIDGPSTELFSNTEESNELRRRLFLCSRVFFRHQYPYSICHNCLEELDVAYSFLSKCISSELKLEEILKNNRSSIDVNLERDIEGCVDANTAIYEDTFNQPTNSDEGFIVETDLKPHIINKAENDNNTHFRCDICDKVLKTKDSLLKHAITMHKNRKYVGHVTGFGATRLYHCLKCSYSTPHSQTLVNHDRKHTGERPYHCHCGKSFTQSSSLVAHGKTHLNETNFTCPQCGKQFKHSFSLKKHTKVHEEGTYSCEICKKVLKTKDSLKHHLRRHYNIKEFNCEECGDTFVTRSELINHKKKHLKSGKTIECHLCGYKTHTKKVLILHLDVVTQKCTNPLLIAFEILRFEVQDGIVHNSLRTYLMLQLVSRGICLDF